MVSHYDPENSREVIQNRWGEMVGVIYLRDGYWEFVRDGYGKEKAFTPGELAYIEKRQMELNV